MTNHVAVMKGCGRRVSVGIMRYINVFVYNF